MSKPRHPKVITKKIGRHRMWGYFDEGKITIDPRTKGKAKLELLIHEYMHHIFPDMSEEGVERDAKLLADFLHKNHVRITEPESKGLNG